jgi:stage II sporulation protein D
MKTYFIIVGVFTLLLILVPMTILFAFPTENTQNDMSQDKTFILGESSTENDTTVTDTTTTTTEIPDTTHSDYSTFKVLDVTTNQLLEVSAREYVIGAVCAEIPILFEKETIKAQAVISYTYATRLKQIQESSPSQDLNGADFSNDSTKYQAYYTEQQLKDYYGSNYDEYYSKVSSAVDEILGEVITYDGELIVPVFHSISCGTTEDSKNVWGYSIPYLTSVDSSYDTTASDYSETKTFTPNDLKTKFTTAYPDVTFSNDCTSWVSIQSTSEIGSVISVAVGSICISGTEFRNALGLRSNNFTVTYNGDTFSITTKGYGHGVGLSQYGANQLALQGLSYKDILKHYYTGVEIVKY